MRTLRNQSLPGFAIDHPILVAMAVVTLLVLGGVAYPRVPLDFMMKMEMPALRAWIAYPGASPEEIVRRIAVPAEGTFRTLPGIKRISTNSNMGGCYVWMEFDWNTDMDEAANALRDRIERLRLLLPRDVDTISTRRFSNTGFPIMRLGLFRAERRNELACFARTRLARSLMRLEGVAEVQIAGQDIEQIYVDFDADALAAAGLSLQGAATVLRGCSVAVSVGIVEEAGSRCRVRLDSELNDLSELAGVVVSPNGVRLKDVATVRAEAPTAPDNFAIDGKPGIFLDVIKKPDANAVETCDAVHAELAKLKGDPEFSDVEVFVFEDLSEIIRFALNSLKRAGKYGCLLACGVIWLFLRKVRATLAVGLMIPASLVVAFLFLFFSDRSLNLVTMAALLISSGMLVDNAIVVVENIHRCRTMSVDSRETARAGANEVALAIAASTATTVVVFIPVIYMEAGDLSKIMREFTGPVTISLAASLVFALTVLPVAESRIGVSPKPACRLGSAIARWAARAARLREGAGACYAGVVRFCIRDRTAVAALIGAALLATYFVPFRKTGFRANPEMDLRQVGIYFNAAPNYGEEEAKATVDQIAAVVEKQRKALGIKNLFVQKGGWGGNVRAYLIEDEDLASGESFPCTTEEARRRLDGLLPTRIPGGAIDCGVAHATPESSATVRVQVRGPDMGVLDTLAEQLRQQIALLPSIEAAKVSGPQRQEEFRLNVDEALAAQVGTSATTVAQSVEAALRGSRLPFLKRNGNEVPVHGRLQGADTRTLGDLETVLVQGRTGPIPLAQLVDIERGKAPGYISRVDGQSVVEVEARTTIENQIAVRDMLQRLIARLNTPEGYSVELGENFKQIDETLANFAGAVAMATLLIYLVMAALFESWVLPLSILTTIPLAFAGVYWSMFLSGTPLDTIALAGSVLMCGVIVNNGILIVDCVNRLRIDGLAREDAVVAASLQRLRPVAMTTLTTVVGVLPIAVGGGGVGGLLQGVGRALTGGLVAGTILTLLVVPVVYTAIDDARLWCWDYFAGLLALGRPTVPDPPSQ